jgi:hypothetical protein
MQSERHGRRTRLVAASPRRGQGNCIIGAPDEERRRWFGSALKVCPWDFMELLPLEGFGQEEAAWAQAARV